MDILGNRLKSLREKHNYTQKRVANAIGISNVQLSRFESGDRKPDPDTIKLFADFYDVSVDYLLGRSSNPSFPKAEGFGINERQKKLIEEINKLPADVQEQIEDQAKKSIEMYKKMLSDIRNK